MNLFPCNIDPKRASDNITKDTSCVNIGLSYKHINKKPRDIGKIERETRGGDQYKQVENQVM